MPSYHGCERPSRGHERWHNEYYFSALLSYGDVTDSAVRRYYDEDYKTARSRDGSHEYETPYQNPRIASTHPTGRRSRRSWPPFPRVEDETTSLSHEYQPPPSDTEASEASVRGDIDQQPIILEVNPPTSSVPAKSQIEERGNDSRSLKSISSSESLGPHTPESVDENQDRRYVYIPEKGIEIPLTYDEPRIEKRPVRLNEHERERGRKATPRLDTTLSSEKSPEQVPSPIERERSPYAHAPKPTKPKEARFSGQALLSPDILSPKVRFPETSHRAQAPRVPDGHSRGSGQDRSSPHHSVRPPVYRHASAMAYPGEPASAGGSRYRSRHYEVSSDDSDDSADELSHIHDAKRTGPGSSPMLDRPTPRLDGPVPQKQRKDISGRRIVSPPLRTFSVYDYRAPSPRVSLATSLDPSSGTIPPSSPQINTRQASPRGSPASTRRSSPAASPPGTPGTPSSTLHQGKIDFQPTKRKTLPLSRPSSPSQAHLPARMLPVEITNITENRPGLHSRQTSPLPSPSYVDSNAKTHRPRSSQTSPLPSPQHEGTGVESGPRIDIREPSPAGHRRSTSYTVDPLQNYGTRHASLLPFDMPSSPSLRLPETGSRRRASSNAETRPSFSTDPITLRKAFESPQAAMKLRPTGPIRAVSVGTAPPATLPPCPRKDFVAGYHDWYTLVGFPSFAICPTCRDAVMIPGYADRFTPRAPKPRGQKTRCDFGVPWMRMAWLMTISQKRSDVNLIYAMAEVAAHEPLCPGKVETLQEWYKIDDPDTGRHVSNFNVCSYCVRNVETLFPVLRGIFHKARRHPLAQERICDLRTDSQRFSCYVDLLEETANHAIQFRRAPNILRFVEFAKRMVANRECPAEDVLRGQEWYIIPHVPEFTACEECYDLIVCPAIERGSSLAAQFTRKPQLVAPPHVGVSCQLYSPKMRRVFREACEWNDVQHLRSIAVQRHAAERNLQMRQAESHKYPENERVDRMADFVREWRRWE